MVVKNKLDIYRYALFKDKDLGTLRNEMIS